MSAEFPIDVKFSATGANTVISSSEALLDVLRNGTKANIESLNIIKTARSEYYRKAQALRMLGNEFRYAHPNLMLFTRGLSAVSSVARTGMNIFNSLNLMLLSTKRSHEGVETALRDVEIAQRDVTEAERIYGKDSKEAVAARERLTVKINASKTALQEEKDEISNVRQQQFLFATVSIPMMITSVVGLIGNMGELKASVLAAKTALAELGAVGLGTLGLQIAAVLLPITAFALGYETFMDVTKDGISTVEDADKAWNKMLETTENLDPATRFLTRAGAELPLLFVSGMLKIKKAMEPTEKVFNDFSDSIKKVRDSTIEFVLGAGDDLLKWLFKTAQESENTRSEFVGKLKLAIQDIQDKIRDALPKEFNDLLKWLDDVREAAKPAAEKLRDMIVALQNQIRDALSRELKAFGDWIQEQIDKLLTFLGLKKEAATVVTTTSTTTQSTTIPSRQSGGYIPYTGLYNLHAGEYVVPASGGEGRSVYIGKIEINVPATRDMANEISRQIVLTLNRTMRWG